MVCVALADGRLERDVEIEYATFDATAQSNSFARIKVYYCM